MERVTVRMSRGERNIPWGFGVTETQERDVMIVNVIGGSLADRAGLRNGDILEKLEDLDNLDINAVDRLLVTSRDRIELVVHRNSGGQTRIWRPEITDMTSSNRIPPVEERPYRVSLEHNSDTVPPQGFNKPALPFNPDPRVRHLQYNSPMGLYSNDNVAESYVQQTAGIVNSARPGVQQNEQPAYLKSETLRLLKEQEGGGGARQGIPTLSSHPNPSGLPVCFVCTRPILGVMARAAGHEIHGECLSCATCGNSLRNIGHHFIEGKFYCDIHGTQRKSKHSIMDPNLAVRTAPTAAHPVRPTENVRAFYQPEVMSRKTLSPSPVPSQTTVHTHYSNPKTQGTISPSNRGVPTIPNYAGDQRQSMNRVASPQPRPVPVQQNLAPPTQPAPPVPSNPPPVSADEIHVRTAPTPQQESRVPSSVRAAVSPRRSSRAKREWPPRAAIPTSRYWQIDPAGQAKAEKEAENKTETGSLQEIIRNEEKKPNRKRNDPRRKTHIEMGKKEKPEIHNGIHWTVISGPKPVETTVVKVVSPVTERVPEKCIQQPEQKNPDTFHKEMPSYYEQEAPKTYIVRNSAFEPHIVKNARESYTVQDSKCDEKQPETYIVRNPVVDKTPKSVENPKEPSGQLLNVQPTTTDSSTSPIPVIRLGRQKSLDLIKMPEKPSVDTWNQTLEPSTYTPEYSRFPCTSSPIPFAARDPPFQRVTTPPAIRVETKSPFESASTLIQGSGGLIGTNISPRPFAINGHGSKALKKVDFSNNVPTVIPEPKWAEVPVAPERKWAEPEILDESDILTDVSRRSDDSRIGSNGGSEQVGDQLRVNAPYDGDESEQCTVRSDTTVEETLEDEREEWMREELELARKEELAMLELEEMRRAEIRAEIRERELSQLEKEERAVTQGIRQRELEQLRREEGEAMREAARRQEEEAEKQRLAEGKDAESSESQGNETVIVRVEEVETQSRRRNSVAAEEREEWRQQAMELLNDEGQRERDLAMVAALNERLQGLRDMEESDRQRAIECIERHQMNLEDQQEQLAGLLDSAIQYLRNLDSQAVDQIVPAPPTRLESCLRTESLSEALDELKSIELPVKTENLSSQLRRFEENGETFSRNTLEKREQSGARTDGKGQGALQNPGGRIPYCESCKQQIRGAFVLATGLAWCPEHFVCANNRCGRRLLECGFVEENGQKYCEGCFETHIAPRCSKCAKPIVSDCLNALQKKWHPTCFTCAHCQKPFGNSAFYLENGLPYCERDWNQLFTTKCVSCKFAIEAGDRWVEALGSAFHSNCFTCTRCNSNLEGQSFFAKNGQPYCKMHA